MKITNEQGRRLLNAIGIIFVLALLMSLFNCSDSYDTYLCECKTVICINGKCHTYLEDRITDEACQAKDPLTSCSKYYHPNTCNAAQIVSVCESNEYWYDKLWLQMYLR